MRMDHNVGDVLKACAELGNLHVTAFKVARGERDGGTGLVGVEVGIQLQFVYDSATNEGSRVMLEPFAGSESGGVLCVFLRHEDFEDVRELHSQILGGNVPSLGHCHAGGGELEVVRRGHALKTT